MILIYVLVVILLILYLYIKWVQSYWKRKSVEYIQPEFFFGNIDDSFNASPKVHRHVLYSNFYNYFKKKGLKYGGIYNRLMPVFIPMDLELVKSILQTDFYHFRNRGEYVNIDGDPLSGHLFNLRDERWRSMRSKLTPIFTSGKIKTMFQAVAECTTSLNQVLSEHASRNDPADIKDILCRFTIDIISSVAFGLDVKTLKDSNSQFVNIGRKIFRPSKSLSLQIKRLIAEVIPIWMVEKMKVRLTRLEIEDFFVRLVKKMVHYRETNNVYRKDFMHLLIQLKNMNKVSDNGQLKQDSNTKFLTIKEMTAQSFGFYIAGFETSASTMTFALMNLAFHQDIQDKARKEIVRVLEKYDNQITYEAIMEMTYLDQILSETLRINGVTSVLRRICVDDYKVPNSDLVLKSGTLIRIPVCGIHTDPEYYENPEKFDPDRFSPENKNKIPPFAYLPFGEGPRFCIGVRFGKIQSKLGLSSILQNYKVTINKKTKLPITYAPHKIFPEVEGGLWLNLESIC